MTTRFLMNTNNDETDSAYLVVKLVLEMFLIEMEKYHVCLHLVL